MRVFAAASFIGVLFAAQGAGQTNVQAPLSGLVFDGSAVRPILGLPGASQMGDAIGLGFRPAAAAFSFANNYGLAIDSNRGTVVLLRGVRSGQIVTSVLGSTTAGDVRIGAAGTAAVLVSEGDSTFQMIQGLPDHPTFSQAMPYSGVPPLTALDVDAAGSNILAAFSDGVRGEVDRFDAAGTKHFITAAVAPSAVEFINGGHDAAIADSGANQILIVRDIQGAQEQVVAASGADLNGDLSMSVWNSLLLVGSSGSQKLFEIDLTQLAVKGTFQLSVAPTRIDPLNDSDVFLISDFTSHPIYVIRMADSPSTFFIPGNTSAGAHAPRRGHARD